MNRVNRAGLLALSALVVVGTACSSGSNSGGSGGRVGLRPGADAVPSTVGPSPTVPTVVPNLPSVPPVTAPQSSVLLTDDTGMLTVEVPSAWTDVDTRPFVNDDGTLRPGLGASTDLARFDDFWDAPGVVYTAYNFEPDPNVLFGVYDYTEFCTDGGFAPYTDGVFVGYIRTFTGCSDAGSTNFIIVANAPGNTVTVVLIIQVVTAEDNAAYQHIVETFNVNQSVGMPTETVPPSTTLGVPTVPVPTPPVTVATAPVPTVAPAPLPTSPLLTTPVTTASPGGKRNSDPRAN